MKIRYLKAAEAELDEAVGWYRVRSAQAARHFSEEVAVTERLLARHPRIGKAEAANIRSVCVSGFPFTLFYAIGSEEILVLALAHHRRRPGYWHERMKQPGT